jgi:hypothetical protein
VIAGVVLVDISCSSRSPDLALLIYFLWSHLKNLVYEAYVRTKGALATDIPAACETLQNTPGIFERVRQKSMRRHNSCN